MKLVKGRCIQCGHTWHWAQYKRHSPPPCPSCNGQLRIDPKRHRPSLRQPPNTDRTAEALHWRIAP